MSVSTARNDDPKVHTVVAAKISTTVGFIDCCTDEHPAIHYFMIKNCGYISSSVLSL